MISILMATYNGETYLRQQIESLLNQTRQDFVLYVCDDCSTDGTYRILLGYAEQYPDRIKVYQNSQNSGDAKWNFLGMMLRHQDDYVMLCDQDDVWQPDKIELSLAAVQEREKAVGRQTPVLMHTDLYVVDEELRIINPSLNYMLGLSMKFGTMASQVIQNTITGCTSMYNRALAELIKAPSFCIMHDWWLGLIVTAFGQKVYLPQATMMYRQHGRNAIGAKQVRSLAYIVRRMLHVRDIRAQLDATYRQAAAFLQEYGAQLSAGQREFLQEYSTIPQFPKFARWRKIDKLRAIKSGFVQRIAQFLYI